jgi:apocytochrome f
MAANKQVTGFSKWSKQEKLHWITETFSPDPSQDSSIHFGKYQLHVGGNRGRGQVTPEGVKSNNNVFTTPVAGRISASNAGENGGSVVEIKAADGSEWLQLGPSRLVVRLKDPVI